MSEATEDPNLAVPAGEGDYVVQPGDCLASIADRHGFFWQTLWDLPENSTLKEARKDPNILLPGDRVTIPDLRAKRSACVTGHTHRFRRRGIPEKLRVQLTSEKTGPRAELDYELVIEGDAKKRTGRTDQDGFLEEWIPPTAMRGKLILPEGEQYPIDFGGLDPINSVAGARARLINLRLMAPGDDFHLTLEELQTRWKLEPTGELDPPTQAKIVELYGC